MFTAASGPTPRPTSRRTPPSPRLRPAAQDMYLAAYNLACMAGWAYVLWLGAREFVSARGGGAQPLSALRGVWRAVRSPLFVVQWAAVLEVAHAAVGIVPSPVFTTALQVASRVILVAVAEAAGGIAGVLDVTVDYLNTRSTFGRKIGRYQALKHTCADILVGLERSRSHLYHAATLCAAGHAEAEIALRMAKAEASDVFAHAGDRAVQFHGGFGFTWECDAQLFLRRALWLQYGYGDSAHHRRLLAGLLLG